MVNVEPKGQGVRRCQNLEAYDSSFRMIPYVGLGYKTRNHFTNLGDDASIIKVKQMVAAAAVGACLIVVCDDDLTL